MMPATLAVPFLPVFVIRVLSPSLVFLTTISLLFTHPPTPSSPSPITSVVVATRVPRRAVILTLLSLSALTFLLDGLTFVVHAVFAKHWPRYTGIEINAVVGLAAFAGLAALGSWKEINGVQVWLLKRVKATIAAASALDIALAVLLGIHINASKDSPPHIPEARSGIPITVVLHFAFTAFRALLLLPLLAALLSPRTVYTAIESDRNIEEPTPTASSFLLPPESGPQATAGFSAVPGLPGDASKYGTFRTTRSNLQRSAPTTRAATPAPSTIPDSKADAKPEIALDPSWTEIWRRIRRLSPYLWPTKDRYLQLLASFCIVILLLGRVINLAMPLALGQLVRLIDHPSGQSPWPFLFAYVGLRFLQGSGGLAAIRDSLWAPVMQYSDREMSQLSFDHLLNLSFAWHTHRKTGEILRVLDRGAAINHTFELILFNIIPTFIDIFVALVAFCFLFEWTLALVIFFVMFAYVAASVILTQWRTKIRRKMNERDMITRGIHTDCLLNYETVKYFGGEEHEGERYREALREYQALEYKVIISLNLLNMVQNFIITLGLLIGSMIVALRVTRGESDSGGFVLFITYLAQLYGPLNQLGYIYRSVNQSLVDTEKLLALLNEPTEVNDKPNAPDLIVNDGEIEFDNVNFSYDGRTTALHGVSFKVPRGSSVALVGESGAGKSTIFRLLYRFYDLGEGDGRILIDGQDIRDVTQKSLRQAIGVVPQDSVLFNASIGYNIGYGKFGSSPEEIEAAANSAQMHDRIMSFPDGYDTKVGERGVRLSGGEKQRVAIARTLLKNPPILLLDEATSALDTSTEKDIQKALQNLVQGRSSLSIAHRLSTIASADLILVLKDGQIVEQGSHKELLARDGFFASMWADQVSASDEPVSVAETITKREVSRYAVEEPGVQAADETPEERNDPDDDVHESSASVPLVDVPEEVDPKPSATVPLAHEETSPVDPAPVAFPTSAASHHESESVKTEVIQAPSPVTSSVPFVAEPLAFPSAADTSPEPQPERVATPAQGPAVTFGANVNSPPSRTGTPEPESEPKRKRISSQNFQRLARRISLSTRRQSSSSSIIPGLKRESPRVSTDDSRGEGSLRNESPAGSIKSDGDKGKLKKKEKKEKSRKSTI
ncbi:Heavy metal tolerance protein [Hypsizygus marmoreus]|uniref:Heavy metal tolerance protein n=1 Tax=Hypsizygus marmoreus TaxID=39966 RepID=A0A369K151_HYPMA|nr:Heavy metal tolerance protein [Hypsizygus marmoreus]